MTERFTKRLNRKLKTLEKSTSEMVSTALAFGIESYIEGAMDCDALTNEEYFAALKQLEEIKDRKGVI